MDDVEVVAQREVLVDDLDAEVVARPPGGADVRRLALEEDLAGVEREDPRDALDHRRLAGAVVADERGDLTGSGDQVDAAQRVHRAEVLAARRAPRASGAGPGRVRHALLGVIVHLVVSARFARGGAGLCGRACPGQGPGRSRGPAPPSPGWPPLRPPRRVLEMPALRRRRRPRCRPCPSWCSRRR